MNTYTKFAPNVFLAKCTESHEKGETIKVTTKYGKENEHIVFNLIRQIDGLYYYSIVRADGFNAQEWARRKAERLQTAAMNAEKKSDQYYQKAGQHRDFLSLGEPIKIGHHSEGRHRKIIKQVDDNMRKCVETSKKAEEYESRAEYWESRAEVINLSMPESLEYFTHKLEQAKKTHEGLKNGTIPKRHSYSLTYAKKEVNELTKKLEVARLLWA
jgi:hypothetical protein